MTQQSAPLYPEQTQCVGLALDRTDLAVDPHRCRQEGNTAPALQHYVPRDPYSRPSTTSCAVLTSRPSCVVGVNSHMDMGHGQVCEHPLAMLAKRRGN
jgi:hypothetical protein